MAELSTKHGIFETGVKDEHGVAYKDGRVVGSYDKHLTEYTVKDGTEVICDRAFYDKKDLRELHLPSSVKAIGESAFAGCKALERVNIPEGVTEIKTATFRDCKSLRRLELPASCTKIAKWAFTDGIETLVCNAPAMQIDKSAFLSCKTLKTVIVPEGCINAYTQAFVPCGFIPLFEEIKEEIIAEEPLYIDDHDEEILDDDIFEDDDENIFEDEEKDNDDDNDLLTNKKEIIMEENLIIKEGDNGKYGYVDNAGNWVIEPKFDEAAEFVTYDDTFNNRSITLSIVRYQEKWGAIKPDGSWHISPELSDMEGIEGVYEFVPTIYNGNSLEGEFDDVCSWMIAASFNYKWGIIDIDGNWIVEPYFEEIHFTPWDDGSLNLTAFYFNADTSININRYGEEI